MSILKVAQMGNPILRMRAQEVERSAIGRPEFQRFCDDLVETMEEYDGVGLAAPQVHVSLRVVVATLNRERGAEFLINPVITVLSDKKMKNTEGCLSVEGLRAVVERPCEIRVEALDRDGTKKTLELYGFPAVIAQHECDHLDGTLYVDRADPRTLAFMKEFKRYGTLDEWDLERGQPKNLHDDEEGEEELDEEDELSDESDGEEVPSAPSDRVVVVAGR